MKITDRSSLSNTFTRDMTLSVIRRPQSTSGVRENDAKIAGTLQTLGPEIRLDDLLQSGNQYLKGTLKNPLSLAPSRI
jgi:hypothetical protein